LGRGLEIGLVQDLSQKVSIPVIVGGGTGKMEHVRAAFKSGASAVCLASVLHYHLLRSTDSARAGLMPPQGVERFSIPDLKDFLESCSLKCRPALMHL
jgi:dihydroorotate dehydrogenase